MSLSFPVLLSLSVWVPPLGLSIHKPHLFLSILFGLYHITIFKTHVHHGHLHMSVLSS